MAKKKFADPKMVSNQKWEIQYIATKFGITPEEVRAVKKSVGRSRRKVYKEITEKYITPF